MCVENSGIYPKCSCGSRVSRKGRLCSACGFANANFREKSCAFCGVSFTPKSGVQKFCEKCRTICHECGGVKSRPGKPCLRCATKIVRKFKRVCSSCGDEFFDSNNKSLRCDNCDAIANPKNCIECGISITRGHKRCNRCVAKARPVESPVPGWRRYEFNGVRYRSWWEVEFAKILMACEIKFDYEMYHKETKTRPDFYIPDKDVFIEIHPDRYGKKEALPKNCVLVKTLSGARAMAFSIAFSLNRLLAIKYLDDLGWPAKRGLSKVMFNAAVYLRQAIYERDGK